MIKKLLNIFKVRRTVKTSQVKCLVNPTEFQWRNALKGYGNRWDI